MLLLQTYYFVVVGEFQDLGRLRSEDGILVIVSYLVIDVMRPCVGRDPVRFSGRPSKGVPMWQWEVPWPDHFLKIQRNNTGLVRF